MSEIIFQLIERKLKLFDSNQFEELCCDLILSQGFKNVKRKGSHNDRDQGRDIEAIYNRILPDHLTQIIECWYFECKYHLDSISVKDIQEKIAWADAEGIDYLGILSPTTTTNNAKLYISQFQNNHQLRIIDWTGFTFTRLLAQSPSIIKSYFSEIMENESIKSYIYDLEKKSILNNILNNFGMEQISKEKNPELTEFTQRINSEILNEKIEIICNIYEKPGLPKTYKIAFPRGVTVAALKIAVIKNFSLLVQPEKIIVKSNGTILNENELIEKYYKKILDISLRVDWGAQSKDEDEWRKPHVINYYNEGY